MSWRVFGRQADSYRLALEFGQAGASDDGSAHIRLTSPIATLEVTWDDSEAETAVVERLTQKLSMLGEGRGEERLHVMLFVAQTPPGASPRINLGLQHKLAGPVLRCITVSRNTSSGTVSESLLRLLLQQCQLDGVWKLKGAEGFGNFWATCTDPSLLTSMRNLNLSYCSLVTLPPSIGCLTALRILRLSHNKLTTLPGELGQLTMLEVLAVDANLLTSVPVEVRRCVALKELNLEGNRIATPVLDLRPMRNTLQSLQLYGNPLEYLPELSPCSQLRSLSLANVRIMADATYTRWEVEVGALPYMARGHKLAPLFRLTFRRASLQHPLLAGALGRIAEERAHCELISKEETALQQLSLMALSDNYVVVRQACKVLGHLAACGVATVNKLMSHDVASAVHTLVMSPLQDSQLCGLSLMSDLASSSDSVSADLLTDPVLERLHELICKGDPSVRQAALQCLSSLLYCSANRRAVLAAPGLLGSVAVLAQAPTGTAASMMARNGSRAVLHTPVAGAHKAMGPQRSEDAAAGGLPTLPGSSHLGYASGSTRLSALRVLAVLGENDCVQDALNMPRITRRGVRVLSLDGGGMKGITIVQMLRAIQARLPKPLHTYWDLVVGTSTGAIIAVSIAMLQMHLDAVEAVYTELGQKVFNAARAAGNEETAASWRDSLYRVYRSSSQHVRVAVYGSKHDPSSFETLVKDFADMKKRGCLSDQLIDTAGLPGIPKVALVSTLTSITPAQPFLFRTYELPSGMETMAAHIAACEGSSRHLVWQAVRASASAPYYLDDFQCGEDRFQDGATTANNPSLIALQQARLLWPNLPVECLVSLGCGCPAPARRERSVSSYLDTGSVLIESACSTDRVHEALATTLPLLPNTHYFRFQPVDERFAVELDDVSPASIVKLQTAASEYCVSHSARFDSLAELLLSTHQHDDEDEAMDAAMGALTSDGGEDVLSPRSGTILKLGRRRGLLVLHAPREVLLPAAAAPPGLQDATVAALSGLSQLLRITDLTTTCSPAAQPAAPAAASEQSPSSHNQPAAPDQSHSPFDQRGPRQQSFGFTFDPRHSPPPGNTPNAVQQPRRPHSSDARPPRQAGATQEGQIPPLALAAAVAGAGGGTVVNGPQTKLSISTTIGFHPAAKSSPSLTSPVASPPTGATETAKPAAAEGDVSVTSPTQDASSTVSSSIFNYFMPRWSVTSPQASDSAAPASTNASPQAQPAQVELAATQSQSATTAPEVQVLVPSHSHPQAATTPTASSSVTAAAAANAAMEQASGGGVVSRPSTGGVGQSQGGSVWFPWSSSAGPSSPVISPATSMSRVPQTFSPTHESASVSGSLGASQSLQGAYLFRSRSKTDSGPAPVAPGTATHSAAGDGVQSPFRDGSASGLHGSMSDPYLIEQHNSAAVPAAADMARAAQQEGAPVAAGRDLAGRILGESLPSQLSHHLHPTSSLQSHPLLEPSSDTVQVSLPSFTAADVQGVASSGLHAPLQLTAAPSLQHLHRWSAGGSSPQNPRQQAHQSGSPGEPRSHLPATNEAAVNAGHITSPTSNTQGGAHRSAGYTTGGIPRPRAVIAGLLEDLAEQGLGVVHLALEPDSGGGRGEGGGLITQWTSEVVSIMEPGPQAAHVVHQLGGAPGAILGEVTGGAVTFLVGLARYTRLSMQEVTTPGGILVRNMLYSVSHPCQMLTAGDVAAAAVEWSSLMVTASCAMPKPLVEAFLRAGVRALVCLAEEPSSPQQQAALPTVFQQLLLQLNSGMPVEDAIKAAEAQDEGICEGLLIIHHT